MFINQYNVQIEYHFYFTIIELMHFFCDLDKFDEHRYCLRVDSLETAQLTTSLYVIGNGYHTCVLHQILFVRSR